MARRRKNWTVVNGKRRSRRRRRNAPLSRAEARALKSILRKHGRRCLSRNPLTRAEALKIARAEQNFRRFAMSRRRRGEPAEQALYDLGAAYGLRRARQIVGVRRKRRSRR